MFDRIFDFISAFFGYFKFWHVIRQFEEGVVLRLGNFNRKLTHENGVWKTGLHFYIPFGFEDIHYDTTVARVINLPSQSLITKDGIAVGLSAVITAKIIDIEKAMLEVETVDQATAAASAGAIGDRVSKAEFAEMLDAYNFRLKLQRAVNAKLSAFGVEATDMQLDDLCKVKNIRIHGM